MTEPIVSIITSIYNCEQFLRDSIESVIAQTFKDYEFIIINDGSTDGSEDIVHYFMNHIPIRYYVNPENKKIPYTRNRAASLAKGKYIAIHDGDDISLPDRFNRQVSALESTSIFCIGGKAIRINHEDEEMGIMEYPPRTHEEIVKTTIQACLNPVIDPTAMFRRQDFNILGGYTLEKAIYTVPDFDLWVKAFMSGRKFYNIQDPIIRYRINEKGMTGKHKKEMIKAHMIVWTRFVKSYIKQHGYRSYVQLRAGNDEQNNPAME